MEPEPLFLRRCEQAAALMTSTDEASLIDLALPLRQLLMDKHSLMDTANKGRIKARFHVGASHFPADDPHKFRTFWSLLDGLDPEDRPPDAPTVLLNRDQFLKHVVMNHFGTLITIKDIIEHTAHVAGGIHHDPRPIKRNTPIGRAADTIIVKGVSIAAFHLKAITRISLRALQPIIDDVRKRQTPLPPDAPSA